jgi:hypothetical protein
VPDETKIDRIRALLSKAESTDFPEEAKTYNAQALRLMAIYGVEETHLRLKKKSGPDPIIMQRFLCRGKYLAQQDILLNGLCNVLHCKSVVSNEHDAYGNRVKAFAVYGTALHVSRVRMLFSSLSMQMLSAVSKVRPEPWDYTDTRTYRLSWMDGYVDSVLDRLGDAEKMASEEMEGAGLVLVDDGERARAAVKEKFGALKYSKTVRRISEDAAEHGARAGRNAHLGEKTIHRQRLAIH